MAGTTKLLTSGGGGVSITPDASIASDITVKVPTSGVSGGTLVCSDSSGNVGIGITTPQAKLDVSASGSGNQVVQLWRSASSNSSGLKLISNSGTEDYLLVNNYSNALAFGTANTERMRIDSSGNLLVGKTAEATVNVSAVSISPGASTVNIKSSRASSGSDPHIYFYNANGLVGSISTAASATSYNTSSDYRLKENIQPMQGALAVVQQLNPVTYTWKADGSDGQGFIAHELQAVVPDCVTGEKDAVDAEGNPVYQGIDTSFLVATLTKAIQELSAKNDALEARLAALEAK